jgi:hypothetical protein
VRNPTGLEILRNLSVLVIEMDDGQRQLNVNPGFGLAFDTPLPEGRLAVGTQPTANV